LGLALARAKQKDEARREFETAASLSIDKPVFRNAEVRAQQELTKLE
jgi:Flp pilus assembly protein TadD